MEWKIGDKYFFKLEDGTCLTGNIKGFIILGNNQTIVINDKFNNEIGFRESEIMKYEKLITNLNKVNK